MKAIYSFALRCAVLCLLPQVGHAQPAEQAAATSFTVTCPAGNGSIATGTTLSTNIVIRNFPANSAAFTVTNVKIYDQTGAVIFNGIPTGLVKRITPGSAVGFATQGNVGNYVGRLTIVTTVSGTTSQSFIDVLAVNLDSDANGKLVSRDSITCRR